MPSSTGTSEKLLQGANFRLEIDQVIIGLFKECTGLGFSSNVTEHRLSNEKGKVVIQKVPGQVKWDDIVLKKSLTDDRALGDWVRSVIDGDYAKYRRNGAIVLTDPKGTPVASWRFVNGWPSGWKGDGLNAGGDEVMAEEVTITHEGLVRSL